MRHTGPEGTAKRIDRVEAFSDGVFAIAITLLVLQFVEPATDAGREKVLESLADEALKLPAYVLSFFVIGRYWIAHHTMFAYVVRYDAGLLVINLVFLMTVAFLPYPSAVLGEHGNQVAPVVFYAVSIALTGMASSGLWWYASHRHRLIPKDLDDELILHFQLRALSAPAVFALSIPFAFWSVYISFAFWVALFPLVRVGLVRRHRRRSRARDGSA